MALFCLMVSFILPTGKISAAFLSLRRASADESKVADNSNVFKVVMNFRRKSVVGFNFDYLGYDLAGFISFTLYNCLLFWSPAVFALYQQKNPGSANPIQFNDVFFCLHAIFIQVHISRRSLWLIFT